ncbi:unnamed protein product, partial [Staurois parvus]
WGNIPPTDTYNGAQFFDINTNNAALFLPLTPTMGHYSSSPLTPMLGHYSFTPTDTNDGALFLPPPH